MFYVSSYESIRHKIKVGDTIAFSGKGIASWFIKKFTNSNITHVGIVLASSLNFENEGGVQDGRVLLLIESLSKGVSIARLSDVIENYKGAVYWLPLSEASRAKMNLKRMFDFLLHMHGRPYDWRQAWRSAFTIATAQLPEYLKPKKDFAAFFCSELVAAGYQASGLLSDDVIPSEYAPVELIRLSIYADDWCQIKGDYQRLER